MAKDYWLSTGSIKDGKGMQTYLKALHDWQPTFVGEFFARDFATIKKSIKRLLTLEKESSTIYKNITKKESVMLQREKLKLSDLHRGIKSMKRIPSAIFVVDGITESIAIKEAKTLNIPTFGIIDSNTDPNVVDFPIPANDDSVKCIKLIMHYITSTINVETGKGKNDIDENNNTSGENKETVKS